MARSRIRDPIHDLIVFPDDKEGNTLWALLDTEPLQRLRRIKQLGFSEYVYPGASHMRLSHSIGAMQMARRMLQSFEKRNAIQDFDEKSHKAWTLATLCAALIHGIGHGPYSHVFEELSDSRGAKVGHEEYTRQLIEETKISGILADAGIADKTLSFFNTEKQSNPYGSIISSQLDCDRLDFLSRDRYFTGIRSSIVDLEWLFDSLSVEKVYTDVIGDAFEYAIVVNKKGKRVIEEYVSSYAKMYKDIYFHKTTRSMQHLATHAISAALEELSQSSIRTDKLLLTLNGISEKPIETELYLSLDDAIFTKSISFIREVSKGEAGEFASRYLTCKPLKCLDTGAFGASPGKIKLFRDALKDNKTWFHLDLLKDKGYKQYSIADKRFTENIIVNVDGEHKRLHEISVIEQSNGHSLRFYFKTDEDRDSAIALLKSL